MNAIDPQMPIKSDADVLGKEIIWTPEVERLGQKMGRWMNLELPGGFGFGVQRNGKSSALRWVASMIEAFVGGPVFVSILDISRNLAERETSLVAEWLNQERVLSNQNAPARLKKKFLEHFEERTQALNTDRVLILVDEAQNLTRYHYGQLISLGNLLNGRQLGLRTCTVPVGQPELMASVEAFANMQELQILGRFMERQHEFLGIAPDEIELVLKAHESDVRRPDGTSQPPALASLFPKAWQEGWRPSAWAPVLVEGIGDVAVASGLPRNTRIPMQHLRSTYIAMLLYVKSLNNPHERMTVAIVVTALTEIGLVGTWSRYAAAMRK